MLLCLSPKQAQERDWRGQHRILIGGRDDIEGDYGQLLASSTFCLMAPGALRLLRAPSSMQCTVPDMSDSWLVWVR